MRIFRLITIYWEIKHRNMTQRNIDKLIVRLKKSRV